MVNLGLAYNKRYWDTLEGQTERERQYTFKEIEELLTAGQTMKDDQYLKWVDDSNSFVLKTTYPGLLIGTGYLHEAPEQNEAIKLGFYFDHTSGMPMIPGSSVKGVLKSYFPDTCIEDGECNEENKRLNTAKVQLISELIGHKLSTCQDIEKLRDSIFGKKSEEDGNGSQQDIFFDATIEWKDSKKILGRDYITPHKIPTQNPTPISMLKILPNIDIHFRFQIRNSTIILEDGKKVQIEANTKKELFKQLLLLGGVGAKTNVGYGQLEEV